MMKNTNKNFKALLILTIIASLSNCNQAETTSAVATKTLEQPVTTPAVAVKEPEPVIPSAAEIKKTEKAEAQKSASSADDSYFSRKGYQNKFTRWFKPYKISIQQGNIITQEMIDEIKLGMSKDQVKHVLGTSVFTDSFDNDQWIYAFSDATNGKVQKEQLLILSFKNDRLNDVKENTVVTDKV